MVLKWKLQIVLRKRDEVNETGVVCHETTYVFEQLLGCQFVALLLIPQFRGTQKITGNQMISKLVVKSKNKLSRQILSLNSTQ